MSNIFFVSDTHFNHANILKFLDKDGKRFRGDIFSSVEEMNEVMIQNWNNKVGQYDKIYHLGDVYFGSDEQADQILGRLNGKKRLIPGNHDEGYRGSPLYKHFEKIKGWFQDKDFIYTHIPMREDQIRSRNNAMRKNVHGHIHQNKLDSENHICICVEHTNYTPVNIDEIKEMAKNEEPNS